LRIVGNQSKSPSSGDCEVTAEPVVRQRATEFDTERAAPGKKRKNPKGHGSGSSEKSADGSRAIRRLLSGKADGLPLVGPERAEKQKQKTKPS